MSNTFVFDNNYLSRKREEIKSEIFSARYKAAGNWFYAKIETATVLTNGLIEVTFLIDHTVIEGVTVTDIELYDYNGARIGGKSVNITRKDAADGILYACCVSLFQVKENINNTGAYDMV